MASPKALFSWPVFFTIYINNINLGLNNYISKSANDTKIGNATLSESDRRSPLEDFSKISDWSVKWELAFNINKCLIQQVGSRNIKNDYEMRSVKIKNVHSVKDLDVTVTSNLKFPSSATSPLKKQTG